MRPVVFDLFHTLVDTEHLRPAGFDSIAAIADICGIELAPLQAFWGQTYVQRETTMIDLTELVQHHCLRFSRTLSDAQRTAIDATFGTCKDDALRFPDPRMVEIVAGLASAAPIGVLSNCHEREVRCWDASPFAPLVSCFGRSTRIGAMKPELVPYRWVIDELGIDAADAVYVGNGSSDELIGARKAGFGSVVHCNIFDRSNGLVGSDEQRRRSTQADASVDTIFELRRTLLG